MITESTIACSKTINLGIGCTTRSTPANAGQHPQRPRAATVRDALRHDQQRDSDLQTASSPKDKTDIATAASQPVPQATTASVERSSEHLFPHSVPTIAYSLSLPSAQVASKPTVVAARIAQQTPADASESNMVLLAGAAAGLLFAGGVFHFSRRVHLR